MRDSANDAFFTAESLENLSEALIREAVQNQARDARVTRTLRRAGWRVFRVWEHGLAKKNEARLVRRLSAAISG